jgi:hypothetical protein
MSCNFFATHESTSLSGSVATERELPGFAFVAVLVSLCGMLLPKGLYVQLWMLAWLEPQQSD